MLTLAESPPQTGDARPHAVVIGAGFGGLAAAARLGARGYRVTLLEKLDKPGGRAYVFEDDGFIFDAGPTIITAPFIFEELWTFCGRKLADDVDLRPLDPFYTLRFHDGQTFTCSGDPQAMREQVAKFSPEDLVGYERYFVESERCYKIGFEQMGGIPFDTLAGMLRTTPEMAMMRADRSVYAHVAKHIKNPKLRVALSFHPLFIGGNPFRVTAVYSLIAYLERTYGVHFAMGGTGSLVQGMARLVEHTGGVIRTNAEVSQILVEGGAAKGVRLKTGETVASDIVVSNADTGWTYKHLLPPEARKRWSDEKIDKANYSMGLFVWYFGTKRRYEDVGHHTILLAERYEELLTEIFNHERLPEDFSLYLHRPTATDPSMAPEGCDSFYVLSPVPNLQGPTDWTQTAELYRRRLMVYLQKTLLPGLEDEIVTSRIMTPLDFKERLLSLHGAGFGMEPRLTQSAWFRPHNRSEDVKNLFIVGAGTHPGAGLPGVTTSARILDKVVPDAAALA